MSEEGDVAQPRNWHQLFEISPLTVFLAEGKDGRVRWELVLLALPQGHVRLCREVVGGAGCQAGHVALTPKHATGLRHVIAHFVFVGK